MSSLLKPRFTPEAYLAIDRSGPVKSEYYGGEIFPMAGASRAHNRISTNVASLFNVQLQGRPCETYASDMRVQVSPDGLYTYPDVVVVCGEPRFRDEREDTLLNPTVVVEVLSKSTEAFDRGGKFAQYWGLHSIADYLLIAQDRCRVEHFVRQTDNQWLVSEATTPEAIVHIASIGCDLILADVYSKVKFRPEEASGAA